MYYHESIAIQTGTASVLPKVGSKFIWHVLASQLVYGRRISYPNIFQRVHVARSAKMYHILDSSIYAVRRKLLQILSIAYILYQG
jgi:hypothetical protein